MNNMSIAIELAVQKLESLLPTNLEKRQQTIKRLQEEYAAEQLPRINALLELEESLKTAGAIKRELAKGKIKKLNRAIEESKSSYLVLKLVAIKNGVDLDAE